MPSPRPSRLLAVAAATVCVIALAACGSTETPGGTPSETATGEGQFGTTAPSPTDEATPASTATTPGGGGGGGGGGNANPYPSNPADYGLEMLRAIAAGNDARIVDLSSLTTAQYIENQNYKARNGQWTHTNCESGSCYYYNQTGDIASIGIDNGRLGQKSAVTSVNIEGGSFPTEAGGYVQAFIRHWIDGSTVGMRAHATPEVVSFIQPRSRPTGGFVTQPTPCGSGRLCLDSGRELAGGQPFGDIIHWVVDQNKLGGPNAIISASA